MKISGSKERVTGLSQKELDMTRRERHTPEQVVSLLRQMVRSALLFL
jgi:hypothetical protein